MSKGTKLIRMMILKSDENNTAPKSHQWHTPHSILVKVMVGWQQERFLVLVLVVGCGWDTRSDIDRGGGGSCRSGSDVVAIILLLLTRRWWFRWRVVFIIIRRMFACPLELVSIQWNDCALLFIVEDASMDFHLVMVVHVGSTMMYMMLPKMLEKQQTTHLKQIYIYIYIVYVTVRRSRSMIPKAWRHNWGEFESLSRSLSNKV